MPVIQIHALPQKADADISKTLKRLTTELAPIMGVKTSSVWATWNPIAPGQFAEGETTADRQPDSTHPPIVNLIAFEGRTPETIETALTRIAEILAAELKLAPGNAFITYTEAGSGRVFTGGKVRKRT